ncbi:ABC transporter ATP-binding protein [Bombiscardovia nodaiensis]|uniref:ABC transporter ATP-binding protein n=1 Tax=Bombiscardovia nodaiensis TaxID=2932181 RepID=A0ABM8B5Y0_9BIFI|nr:ABC transporter ATP-binding protein [Bombiscardovia nodaiensis]
MSMFSKRAGQRQAEVSEPVVSEPVVSESGGERQAQEPGSQLLLDLQGVSKIYGDLHALDHLNLQVSAGQWLAVVGSSGSGKTTLMNILGCMDTPSQGSVRLQGQALEEMSSSQLTEVRKNVIGLVFQKFYLVPHLTALENVMLAQYYHSVVDQAQAVQALERVGLGDRAHHLPSQLSGGEQQRVCVARALINDPKLILADEPTGNLDEANEQMVLDIFRQLHEQGTTLIVVTHDALVASCAQREIMLSHGQLAGERWNDDQARQDFLAAGGHLSVLAKEGESGSSESDPDLLTRDLPVGFVDPTKAAKR